MTLSKAWSSTVSQTGQDLLSQLHVVVVEEISTQDSGTWAGDDKSHPCQRPAGDHQLLNWSHPDLAALKVHQSFTLVLGNQPISLCFSMILFPFVAAFYFPLRCCGITCSNYVNKQPETKPNLWDSLGVSLPCRHAVHFQVPAIFACPLFFLLALPRGENLSLSESKSLKLLRKS